MIPTPVAPIFRPIAERAVLVEFGTALDQAAHTAVLRLDQSLAANPCAGFREAVPAFVNLLVAFAPLTSDHATITVHLRRLLTTRTTAPQPLNVRFWSATTPPLPPISLPSPSKLASSPRP